VEGAVAGRRAIVDYALQRRARLARLRGAGPAVREELCDADPLLLRSARHHGEPTSDTCPVCCTQQLATLTYVFGDELGQYSGRIRTTAELAALAREQGELRVFVVEVCPGCAWNHLRTSYVIGDGVPRRRHVVSDDD
jgi:hypothetical protein